MQGTTVALLVLTVLFTVGWLHYKQYAYYYQLAYVTAASDNGFGSYEGIPIVVGLSETDQPVCLSADGSTCAKLIDQPPIASSQAVLGLYRSDPTKFQPMLCSVSADVSDVQYGKDFAAIVNRGIYDRFKTSKAALHASRLSVPNTEGGVLSEVAENGTEAIHAAWRALGRGIQANPFDVTHDE